ncbi:universal stress protein [Aquabacterium sp.]|uniref:universal stress protein n=1 Tax=Aquabacterium sp. TaxID=1872578 RepID=UPI0035B4C80D
MFKHILVPTDGSDLSQATVACAVSFAKEAGARVTLFYAEAPTPSFYAGLGAIADPHVMQEARERLDGAAQQVLDAASQIAQAAGVPYERLVLEGHKPYALIIQAAEQQGCDLIFMASHGRRGMDALLLGSETNKVLTHSKIPVLVYR